MHTQCIKCFVEQAKKLFIKFGIEGEKAADILVRFRLFIDEHEKDILSAPEASCFLHRMIKRVTQADDLYKKEKENYNNLILRLEAEIRDSVLNSNDPFYTALLFALAGNIIDFGPPKTFDIFKELSVAISGKPAIDHTDLLKKHLHQASTVLYLGDNAGEIVFDKLFIETINHPNLYFAVRGGNIINDVTLKDAKSVGVDKLAKVISNGYDAPSTIINRCSDEFRKIFNKADIIISKGQGNLEGLIDNTDKNIFFLLMIKCSVIAEMIRVHEKNTVVLYNQLMPGKKIYHPATKKYQKINN